MFAKNNTLGQSLFEAIFAVGIASVIITAIVSLSTKNVRNATYSRNKALESRHTQDAIERLRELRDVDWANELDAKTGNTWWCLNTNNGSLSTGQCMIVGTSFAREVRLTKINSNTINAEIKITDTSSSPPSVSMSKTTITNWESPVATPTLVPTPTPTSPPALTVIAGVPPLGGSTNCNQVCNSAGLACTNAGTNSKATNGKYHTRIFFGLFCYSSYMHAANLQQRCSYSLADKTFNCSGNRTNWTNCRCQ